MLKSILHKSTKDFEKKYGYDAGYMHHMIDVSTGAGLRLGLLPILSLYRGPKQAINIWAGAALASTSEGFWTMSAGSISAIGFCLANGARGERHNGSFRGDGT